MANGNNQSKKIRKYRQNSKISFNIGLFIFCFVCIYLVVSVLTYVTTKQITAYEVREGSIVKDNSYTGLIIREETVIYAESEGYVSYFQNESSKIKAGSNVYVLTNNKIKTDEIDMGSTELSEEARKNVYRKTQNYNQNYNSQKFSSVYSLKDEITAALQTASNQTRMVQLDAIIAQSGGNAAVYTSVRDGIMVLSVDGRESITEGSLKPEMFDRGNSQTSYMEDQMKIKAGDPVYKLITSEKWYVYFLLNEETAKELAGINYIKTRIDTDSETIWADFDIIGQDGNIYGRLTYDNSMIRYAEDRFLNVELILTDESGLKIPKSALTEKEVYAVPYNYLLSNKDENSRGVMVKKEDGSEEFIASSQYYISINELDNTKRFAYLSMDDFEGMGELSVVMPQEESSVQIEETEWKVSDMYMPLKNKKTLQGVYNINKGYAVFIPVEVICENDDYYIVKNITGTMLYNYDHIAQDSSTVKENEFIFQ